MRITVMGHAALYIETEDQRIMVDPVFAETLLGGALSYDPPRDFSLEKLPEPTALIMTHAHFDHFHPVSLRRFSRSLPVIAPDDPELLAGLAGLGFTDRRVLAPFATLSLGKTRITPSPSEHDEPEFGVVIGDSTGRFWHMADGEATPQDAARLVAEGGPIDVVSAKFQPAVSALMGYVRNQGSAFNKEELIDWLEAVCRVDPRFVFPYAAGLCFAGRHAWFNRYAFPLAPEDTVALLERRLGRGRSRALQPGDVLELSAGAPPQVHPQAASFVRVRPAPFATAWEPVDVTTLSGLEDAASRADLGARLDAFLDGRVLPWLSRELARGDCPWQIHRDNQVVWQLIVELGGGERLERHLDYREATLAFGRGRHPAANAFTHLSGLALSEALRDKIDASGDGLGLRREQFWLLGDARSYEKIIGVEPDRFFAPAPKSPEQDEGDPVLFFLRYFGPEGAGQEMRVPPPEPAQKEIDGLDVLSRQGATPVVAEKKALLSLLALREAERTGIAITDADVQELSNSFRERFGLLTPEETTSWFSEVGLDLATYTLAMRGFTAVNKIQEKNAEALVPLTDAHAKIAMVRLRDR
jgi:hypothetical protein